MIANYFDHYVLGGGWAMLILIPASVVALAAILRAALLFRTVALMGGRGGADDCPAARLVSRLKALRESAGNLTAGDARIEVQAETLRMYAMLQPLAAMFVLSPLAGLLGSITAIMNANLDAARGGNAEALAAAIERALIPAMWGVAIAAAAYTGFAFLRARLFYCEDKLLAPLAMQLVAEKNPMKEGAR